MRPAQQQCAKRRAQGQCVYARQDSREQDGDRELLVELPCYAAKKCDRREYSGKHQRGGNDRAGNLLHREARRFARAQLRVLLHDALHILDNDDGVVDDERDGEHNRKERDGIGRKSDDVENSDHPDHRDGDGQYGDQGRAPVLQENIDHQHDKREGDGKGDHDFFDRGGHELGRIEDDFIDDVGGEPLRQALELGPHSLGDLQRVGARRLIDHHEGRGLSVQLGLRVVAVGAKLDTSHVLHPHHRPLLAGANDDVLELGGSLQAACGDDGQLLLLVRPDGRAADLTGGRLHVLLSDRRRYIGGRHAQRIHARRIHPDAHAVVEPAERRRFAYAVHPRQGVADIDGGVVAEEDGVARAVRGIKVHAEQDVGCSLPARDAELRHLRRHPRGGEGDPVLYVHGGEVGVRSDREAYGERVAAAVGARGTPCRACRRRR